MRSREKLKALEYLGKESLLKDLNMHSCKRCTLGWARGSLVGCPPPSASPGSGMDWLDAYALVPKAVITAARLMAR